MKEIKNQKLLFLILFGAILFLGGILYINFSEAQKYKARSITLLNANEKYVIFNINETLFQTDLYGNTKSVASFKKLGFERGVGDIWIAKDTLYAVQGRSKEMLQCTLPLSTCKKFGKVSSKDKVAAFDIAFLKSTKSFYITDSGMHKLMRYDENGSFSNLLNPKNSKDIKRFRYPNDIFVKDDIFVFVDTNNHRILGFNKNEKNIFKIVTKPKINELKYLFPTSLTMDKKERIWTIVSDGYFDKGIIKIFQTTGKKERVINAIDDFTFESPTTITSSGDFIFVSDSDNYDIYKFSLNGELLSFGDKRVQYELEHSRKTRVFWHFQEKLAKMAIIVGIILLIVCTIYAIYYENNENPHERLEWLLESYGGNANIEPDEHGIVWLRLKIPSGKSLFYISSVLLLVLVGINIYFCSIGNMKLFFLVSLLTIFYYAFLYYAYLGYKNIRIGIKNDTVFYRDFLGRQESMRADELLLFWNFTLKMKMQKSSIRVDMSETNRGFSRKEVATYLLPLLRDKKFNNECDYALEKLKKKDFSTIVKMFLYIILAILGIIFFLNQYIFSELLIIWF